METSLLENMITDFPITKENAEKLIKEYGTLAYAISLKLYRMRFYFPSLNNAEVKEALNNNIRFKNAVDEIVKAKKELEKVNTELPNKCTDEELNSFIISSFESIGETRGRMLKRGLPVIDSDTAYAINKHMRAITTNTKNMALSMGCSFEGVIGELKDIAEKKTI